MQEQELAEISLRRSDTARALNSVENATDWRIQALRKNSVGGHCQMTSFVENSYHVRGAEQLAELPAGG